MDKQICKQSQTLNTDIIFYQILSRISARSVLCFKSVSKEWFSTISSEEFARKHLAFSSGRQQLVLQKQGEMSEEFCALQYDSLSCNISDIPVLCPRRREWSGTDIFLVGSCHGLLCVQVGYAGEFCVWNPITRVYRDIGRRSGSGSAKPLAYGFGCNRDDFKIMVIFRNGERYELYVFPLRAGVWVEIPIDGYEQMVSRLCMEGILVADTLYWMGQKCVIGIDVVEYKIEVLPLPWFESVSRVDLLLHRYLNSLAIWRPGNGVSELWVFKENTRIWELIVSLIQPPNHRISFLGLSYTGKMLVCHGQLAFERPGRNTNSNCVMGAFDYVDSLVSPFTGIVGGRSSGGCGKGRSNQGATKYGFSLVKGKANHPMKDYPVAKFIQVGRHELGLFAIHDGHLRDSLPAYLQNLSTITLREEDVWTVLSRSIVKAYERTDHAILNHNPDLGRGGSTAVTAILIDGQQLWVGNVGDSRAVLSCKGQTIQMSTDHEPNTQRVSIEGDVAWVPDIKHINTDTDFMIIASGLWQVMSNQEAVDIARKIKDPLEAAKKLATEALNRGSEDNISCIVVRF